MTLKRGLWLTLLDEAGEATPVACDVVEKRHGSWILDALVPPQVYPVAFRSARLRLNGLHLGQLLFREPIVTVTHEPMELRLDFPVDEWRLAEVAISRS